jgi:hypothetical protein
LAKISFLIRFPSKSTSGVVHGKLCVTGGHKLGLTKLAEWYNIFQMLARVKKKIYFFYLMSYLYYSLENYYILKRLNQYVHHISDVIKNKHDLQGGINILFTMKSSAIEKCFAFNSLQSIFFVSIMC